MAFQHQPATLLEVEVGQAGAGTIVTPTGELDVATAPSLRDAVRSLTGDGQVTLDLSRLSFIDVTGVRTVLDIAAALGGRLDVLPGPPHVQRVFALTGVDRRLRYVAYDNVTPFPSAAERNLKFVRRIWKAFAEDGIDAMIQIVPADVAWQPWGAEGRTLNGSTELRAFWTGVPEPARGMGAVFSSLGDDVLVQTSLAQADGSTKQLFSLYRFERGTLLRATSFEAEADARASLAPAFSA